MMLGEVCHPEKLTGFGKETIWAVRGDVRLGTVDVGLGKLWFLLGWLQRS